MSQLVDLADDLDFDDVATAEPATQQKSNDQKREVKRRLDDYLEQRELRKALGLDD